MRSLSVVWRILNCKLGFSSPYYITLNVSGKCNSKCLTCDFWRSPNQNELEIHEFRQLFLGLPEPFWVTLGGGEPFLRSNLLSIAYLLKQNYPRIGVGLSTNGLVSDTAEKVSSMLGYGFSSLMVTVSVDGIEKVNDEIRGVEGGFHRALETYIGLQELERRHKNFKTGINYTISQYNAGRLREFCETVRPASLAISLEHRGAAFQNVGEEIGYTNPDKEAVLSDLNYLLEHPELGRGRIKHIFIKLAKKFVQNPSRMVLPCSALRASCFIASDGTIYPCSVWGERIGSIRKESFQDIWRSLKAQWMRKEIKEGRCPICWSGCESTSSIAQNMPWVLKELFW